MALKIEVDNAAHNYVTECVRLAEGEIGGIGYVELVQPGLFYISDFVLLPQEASWASVDFDDKSYIAEITKAAENGKEDQLRVSWHSHGTMDTYFSGTDDQGIKEYKALGMPWLLSLVFNKKGDIAHRVDIFDSEVSSQITMSDFEYHVVIDDGLAKKAEEDVKQFVKKPKSTTVVHKGYKGGSGGKHSNTSSQKDYVIRETDSEADLDIAMALLSVDSIDDPADRALLEMHFGKKEVADWVDERP